MSWLSRILDLNTPLEKHKHDAADWGTCAFGETRQAVPLTVTIPTYPDNKGIAPMDDLLDAWGMEFYDAVGDGDRPLALRLLFKIQKRIAKLAGVKGIR